MKKLPYCIILAAGLGKRMQKTFKKKDLLPKVLIRIKGKPMLGYLLRKVEKLGFEKVFIIIGYRGELVRDFVKKNFKNKFFSFVMQKPQLGTGHAVMQVSSLVKELRDRDVMVLCGDVPFIRKDTLRNLLKTHQVSDSAATVLTAVFKDPAGYGRIVRNKHREIIAIAEHRDADSKIKKIREINSGIYCFNSEKLFTYLNRIKNNNAQGEYYLTDILQIFFRKKFKISGYRLKDPVEISGFNTKSDIKRLENMDLRTLKSLTLT